MNANHNSPRPHEYPHPRRFRWGALFRSRWSVAALTALVLIVTASAAFADDNGRSRGDRHQVRVDSHSSRQNRHSDRDRGRYDRHDNRGDRHDNRYDRHDNRYDHYRYNWNRYDRYSYHNHSPGTWCNHHDHGHYPYFSFPRRIAYDTRSVYRDYYYDEVYYPAHGHYHTIYRFPVYVGGSLTYRPYSYCDGEFFASGYFAIDGPHFSIQIGF